MAIDPKQATHPADSHKAMRFIDPGHRRSWAKNIDLVRENDREAREALASGRGGMR